MSTPPEYPGGDSRPAGGKSAGGEGAMNAYQWEEGLPAPNDLTPMHQSLVSPLLAEAFCLPQQHGEGMHARVPSRQGEGPSTAYTNQPQQFQQDAPGGYVRSMPGQGYGPRHRVPDPGYPGYGGSHQQGAHHYQGVPPHGMPPSVMMYPGPSPFSSAGQAYPVRRQDLNFAPREGPSAMPAEPPDQHRYAQMGQYEEGSGSRHMSSRYSQETYEGEDGGARALKRPRLVWTPQLHKRFVDAVTHLGIKTAVPKTIMQLMNVEGLTRENVASHLQKYRLYVKRVQRGEEGSAEGSAGGSSKAASPADSAGEKDGEGGGNEGHNLGSAAVGRGAQEGGQNESGGAGYGSGSNVQLGDGGSAQGEQGGSSEGQGRGGADEKDQA